MSFQIKISGIDKNSDKSIWVNIDHEDIKEESEYIRYKKRKTEIEEIENKIKVLSLDTNKNYKLNKEQEKMLNYIKENINSNKIITISGIAGAGKTFTILNIFDELEEEIKNKTICFCAPTNNVVERSKQYKKKLEKYFKNVDFCTTSTLLGEKCYFTNEGEKSFKIIERKTNRIYKNDIIVIDEISMINKKQLDYIIKNKNKIGLCILLGDKNQLNPVECEEIDILNKSEINLIENMRCDNSSIHNIHNFIINHISNFNIDMNLNKFIYELYNLLYEYKNNKTIFIVNTKEELVDLYLSIYKKEKTIIGNYRNEECEKINNQIKNEIIKREKIECIDDYFINQQIVFKEPYEDWNTSEFATINNISINNYKFKKLNEGDIINNIMEVNIDKYYNQLEEFKIDKYCNKFMSDEKTLFKYQKVYNYLIHISKTYKEIKEIFRYINIFSDLEVLTFSLNNGNPIKIIRKSYKKDYETSLKNIIYKINSLNKLIDSKSFKTKSLYYDIIIQPLWQILNKYRVDIFAQIDSAFSCTIHRLQGCTIDNICVNLLDIFRMTELKNKLKCIYTCFSRCSKKLILYLPTMPLCKCGLFCKERLHEDIYIWSCSKKKNACGFMKDKSVENKDCKKCEKCKEIYYKTMINELNNICNICKK